MRLAGIMLEVVSHDALEDISHCLLDVTVTNVLLAADPGPHELVDRLSVGGGVGCWVTDIVRCMPVIDTVMVPCLELVPVLAVAFILNVPLPVRLAGIILLIVSQDALLETFHVVLDTTSTKAKLSVDGAFQLVVDMLTASGGCCLTSIVRVMPGLETVIMPVLTNMPLLAVVFNLKLPLPMRLDGQKLLTVSQGTLLETFHCMLELDDTVTVILLAFEPKS